MVKISDEIKKQTNKTDTNTLVFFSVDFFFLHLLILCVIVALTCAACSLFTFGSAIRLSCYFTLFFFILLFPPECRPLFCSRTWMDFTFECFVRWPSLGVVVQSLIHLLTYSLLNLTQQFSLSVTPLIFITFGFFFPIFPHFLSFPPRWLTHLLALLLTQGGHWSPGLSRAGFGWVQTLSLFLLQRTLRTCLAMKLGRVGENEWERDNKATKSQEWCERVKQTDGGDCWRRKRLFMWIFTCLFSLPVVLTSGRPHDPRAKWLRAEKCKCTEQALAWALFYSLPHRKCRLLSCCVVIYLTSLMVTYWTLTLIVVSLLQRSHFGRRIDWANDCKTLVFVIRSHFYTHLGCINFLLSSRIVRYILSIFAVGHSLFISSVIVNPMFPKIGKKTKRTKKSITDLTRIL